MEQVDEGIVGIITNHAFLDNITFPGMRQSLMQTFNQIYILDLHGNSEQKETAPDGSKDENVFDIKQGVAISLFVKKKGLSPAVFHTDLFGQRKPKYKKLLEESLSTADWEGLTPDTPNYLFIPQDETQRAVYEEGWKLSDIFVVQSTGVKTHRDHFVIDFDEGQLRKRIDDFRDLSISDSEIARKYKLESNRDWNLSERRKALASDDSYASAFYTILYRPFDVQAYFQHDDAVDWTRNEVMRHFTKDNIGLGYYASVCNGGK